MPAIKRKAGEPIPDALRRKAIDVLRQTNGNVMAAHKATGMQWKTCARIRDEEGIEARASGVNDAKVSPDIEAAIEADLRKPDHPGDYDMGRRHGVGRHVVRRIRERLAIPALPAGGQKKLIPVADAIRTVLKTGPMRIEDIAAMSGATIGDVLDGIEALKAEGINVTRDGDRISIPRHVEQSWTRGVALELTSRPDNTFVFGVAGDKHIASKYHRDDVLADLYRRFDDAGVDAIFDTGNWIDGEARFNRFDLVAHGHDAQVRLMAKSHPKIVGITTYAIWGDDHEGWIGQREGIDIGRYAEDIMRQEGHLWTDLGFMEAHVILKNANTGATVTMAVTHPGGGSAYATSYAPQKAIEALEGGEKPAVALFGHWHKLEALNIRNVWAIQTGCCQDQTPFARKKRLDFHVGGLILRLEQDPKSGAIIGCAPEMLRYFVRSYYNNRWSHHGDVGRPERSRAGV